MQAKEDRVELDQCVDEKADNVGDRDELDEFVGEKGQAAELIQHVRSCWLSQLVRVVLTFRLHSPPAGIGKTV